jgi:hypothetical protein
MGDFNVDDMKLLSHVIPNWKFMPEMPLSENLKPSKSPEEMCEQRKKFKTFRHS